MERASPTWGFHVGAGKADLGPQGRITHAGSRTAPKAWLAS